VIWVKLKDEKINLTHGYYFMHSYEVCLIGYKCRKGTPKEQRVRVRHAISWNTVFAEVREKSQKPEDIYALIDIMFKGGKKVEIFARNHNLRFGIFSMGNELGESYDKWLLRLECDKCGESLSSGRKRFKSKGKPNYDLCQKCVASHESSEFF
jgi:N6-adenosine-specific RNA methylase IME4